MTDDETARVIMRLMSSTSDPFAVNALDSSPPAGAIHRTWRPGMTMQSGGRSVLPGVSLLRGGCEGLAV